MYGPLPHTALCSRRNTEVKNFPCIFRATRVQRENPELLRRCAHRPIRVLANLPGQSDEARTARLRPPALNPGCMACPALPEYPHTIYPRARPASAGTTSFSGSRFALMAFLQVVGSDQLHVGNRTVPRKSPLHCSPAKAAVRRIHMTERYYQYIIPCPIRASRISTRTPARSSSKRPALPELHLEIPLPLRSCMYVSTMMMPDQPFCIVSDRHPPNIVATLHQRHRPTRWPPGRSRTSGAPCFHPPGPSSPSCACKRLGSPCCCK